MGDHLGHLVPPGRLRRPHLEQGLLAALEHGRFTAGIGVPSAPTRYVVSMHPADRAWLDPELQDILARVLERHAERVGLLVVGGVQVEFETRPELEQGRPQFWAGFVEDDLLVLADANAAAEVFAAHPIKR